MSKGANWTAAIAGVVAAGAAVAALFIESGKTENNGQSNNDQQIVGKEIIKSEIKLDAGSETFKIWWENKSEN